MTFEVRLAEPAMVDIAQTFDFIAAQSSSAAGQWLDAIQKAIDSLAEMPERAAAIPENALFAYEYRHLIHQAHRIVFRVEKAANVVFVVRVYHGARAPLQGTDLP